jgi:hypothetical protein
MSVSIPGSDEQAIRIPTSDEQAISLDEASRQLELAVHDAQAETLLRAVLGRTAEPHEGAVPEPPD